MHLIGPWATTEQLTHSHTHTHRRKRSIERDFKGSTKKRRGEERRSDADSVNPTNGQIPRWKKQQLRLE